MSTYIITVGETEYVAALLEEYGAIDEAGVPRTIEEIWVMLDNGYTKDFYIKDEGLRVYFKRYKYGAVDPDFISLVSSLVDDNSFYVCDPEKIAKLTENLDWIPGY